MKFAGFLRLFGGYLYVGILPCIQLLVSICQRSLDHGVIKDDFSILFHNWGSFQGLVVWYQ